MTTVFIAICFLDACWARMTNIKGTKLHPFVDVLVIDPLIWSARKPEYQREIKQGRGGEEGGKRACDFSFKETYGWFMHCSDNGAVTVIHKCTGVSKQQQQQKPTNTSIQWGTRYSLESDWVKNHVNKWDYSSPFIRKLAIILNYNRSCFYVFFLYLTTYLRYSPVSWLGNKYVDRLHIKAIFPNV